MNGAPEVKTTLPLPPEQAFRLLEDPSSLQRLVAGARRIRRFDATWPEMGTRIHHSVGVAPLVIRDHSEVVSVEPPRRLVLDAHIRPLGVMTVEMTLEPDAEGSLFRVRERPKSGLVALPAFRLVTEGMVTLRNLEIARRYRRLATRRRRLLDATGGRQDRGVA